MDAMAGWRQTLQSSHGYALTLLVGVLGAVAVIVAVSRTWVWAAGTSPGLPTVHVGASGADVAPLAGGLGFVLLAGFGAVIATRRLVRRCVGGLMVALAVVVVVV
ncbi:MAG: Trp biosynthesis-associated membrane protein, partial [Sciscionella sp.]